MEHLIPDAWFQAVESMWILLGVVAVAILVLGKGADGVVEGAADLARRMGLGEVIVGATVVSLGTTTPEAAVSVMAAWGGHPDLALGNAIGSVICDTALIFGLATLLVRLPIDRFVLNRHGWLQFGSGVLLAVVCVGATLLSPDHPVLPREVGFAFLGLLAWYLWISVHWARQHPVTVPPLDGEPGTPVQDFFRIALGLSFVIVASRVLIGAVTELALRWGVPDGVVAATLVAFGTSLPELVTAITAIRKGHPNLVIGNVVGADILNVLFVVGASAAAVPLAVGPMFLTLHLPFMLGILALFRAYIYFGGDHFRRGMGVPLLLAYAAYVTLQYVS